MATYFDENWSPPSTPPAGAQGTSGVPTSAIPPDFKGLVVPLGTKPKGGNVYTDDEWPSDTKYNTGPLSRENDEGWLSGAAKGAATASIKGLADIGGTLGGVGDLGAYLLARAESKATGEPVEKIMPKRAAHVEAMKESIPEDINDYTQSLMSANPGIGPIGASQYRATKGANASPEELADPVLKKTGEYVPTSEYGKLGMAGTEMAVSGLIGGPKAAIKHAVPNFVAGDVAHEASKIDPLLGIAAAPLAATGTSAAIKAGKKGVRSLSAGFGSKEAQEQLAAEKLEKAATDPDAVRQSLGLGDVEEGASSAMVPGSKPTTPELTGDQGLLEAQRSLLQDKKASLPFKQRQQEQNTALQEAMSRQAGPGDKSMEVPEEFGRQSAAIDTKAENVKAGLESTAKTAAQDLDTPPSDALSHHLDTLDQAAEHAIDMIEVRARAGSHMLTQQGIEPEAAGSTIRSKIDAVRKTVKDIRNSLYDAIDPGNTLNVVTSKLRRAAKSITKGIDPLENAPSSDEAALFAKASGLSDVTRFKSLRKLDGAISEAMSTERRANGETASLGRLVELKKAVKTAIADAVDNQHEWEQRAIKSGAIKPEQTMATRLKGWSSDLYGSQVSTQSGRASVAGNLSGVPGGEAPASAGVSGAKGEARGRPTVAPGPAGLPKEAPAAEAPPAEPLTPKQKFRARALEGAFEIGENAKGEKVWARPDGRRVVITGKDVTSLESARTPEAGARHPKYEVAPPKPPAPEVTDEPTLRPNMDQWAGERTAKANAAHAGYKQTYSDNKFVGPILKSKGYAGQHEVPDSAVPGKTFVKGDTGYEATKSFLKAAKNDDEVISTIADKAVEPLARSLKDGIVTPDALAKWKQDYAGSLRAMDEVVPGFSNQFDITAKEAGRLRTEQLSRKTTAQAGKAAFRPGPEGYYGTQKFLQRGGAGALDALEEHALNPLRDALSPDKTLTQAALDKYKAKYSGALKAIDEHTPGFSSRFDTAAKATEALAEGTLKIKQMRKELADSEAMKFLGKTKPEEVEAQVGSVLKDQKNGPTRVRQLVAQAKATGNDAVLEGLREAAANWAAKLISNQESGTSGIATLSPAKMDALLKNHRAALAELFTPEQMNNFNAIRDVAVRNQRVLSTNVKGSPGTTKDLMGALGDAASKHGAEAGIAAAAGGAGVEALSHHGFSLQTAKTLGAGILTLYISQIVKKGKNAVADRVSDALLNPEYGRYLFEKAGKIPAKENPLEGFARGLRRSLMAAPIAQRNQ